MSAGKAPDEGRSFGIPMLVGAILIVGAAAGNVSNASSIGRSILLFLLLSTYVALDTFTTRRRLATYVLRLENI